MTTPSPSQPSGQPAWPQQQATPTQPSQPSPFPQQQATMPPQQQTAPQPQWQPPAPVAPSAWQPPQAAQQDMGTEPPPQGPMLAGPYYSVPQMPSVQPQPQPQPQPQSQGQFPSQPLAQSQSRPQALVAVAKKLPARLWWALAILAVAMVAVVGTVLLTQLGGQSGGTPTQQALATEAKQCAGSRLAISAGRAVECTVDGNTLNITQELGRNNDFQGDIAGAMGRMMWASIHKTYDVNDFEVHYTVLYDGELRDEATIDAGNHEKLTGDSEILGNGNYMDENGNFQYASNLAGES